MIQAVLSICVLHHGSDGHHEQKGYNICGTTFAIIRLLATVRVTRFITYTKAPKRTMMHDTHGDFHVNVRIIRISYMYYMYHIAVHGHVHVVT